MLASCYQIDVTRHKNNLGQHGGKNVVRGCRGEGKIIALCLSLEDVGLYIEYISLLMEYHLGNINT